MNDNNFDPGEMIEEEITFDNSPTGYPMSPERIEFETIQLKNPDTSKLIQELPVNEFSPKAIVDYAKHHKLAAIKQNEAYYLFDKKLISPQAVKQIVQSGEYGNLLGYSENSIPEDGDQVAVSIDGEFTADPRQILDMRDNNKLGLTWRAQSIEDAAEFAKQYGQR